MKCSKCESQMFITDETTNSSSHVTFYRCSLCTSEHVSSEPIRDNVGYELAEYSDSPNTEQRGYLMT